MIFDNKDVKFQSLVWETGTERDIITGLQFKNVHLDKFLQNLYGKKMLKFCWFSLMKIGNTEDFVKLTKLNRARSKRVFK